MDHPSGLSYVVERSYVKTQGLKVEGRGRYYDVQPGQCELTHLYRCMPLLKRVDLLVPEQCEIKVTMGTIKKLTTDQSPMARRNVGRAGVVRSRNPSEIDGVKASMPSTPYNP